MTASTEPPVILRTCSRCGDPKEPAAFAWRDRAHTARHSWCRRCEHQHNREKQRKAKRKRLKQAYTAIAATRTLTATEVLVKSLVRRFGGNDKLAATLFLDMAESPRGSARSVMLNRAILNMLVRVESARPKESIEQVSDEDLDDQLLDLLASRPELLERATSRATGAPAPTTGQPPAYAMGTTSEAPSARTLPAEQR
jgi:hypothetical protein